MGRIDSIYIKKTGAAYKKVLSEIYGLIRLFNSSKYLVTEIYDCFGRILNMIAGITFATIFI